MNETELVDRLYSKRDLGHVEPRDVFGEDFILDQHGHQITTGQEFHEHVKEGAVLKRCV